MNKTILTGRLTADPELKKTTSGISVVSFTIAVDRPAAKGEEKQADFFDCVAWRQTAEFLSKWFCKGKPIGIDGHLQTRTYTNKDNRKIKLTEVVADNVEFLPGDGVRPPEAASAPSEGKHQEQTKTRDKAPNTARELSPHIYYPDYLDIEDDETDLPF